MNNFQQWSAGAVATGGLGTNAARQAVLNWVAEFAPIYGWGSICIGYSVPSASAGERLAAANLDDLTRQLLAVVPNTPDVVTWVASSYPKRVGASTGTVTASTLYGAAPSGTFNGVPVGPTTVVKIASDTNLPADASLLVTASAVLAQVSTDGGTTQPQSFLPVPTNGVLAIPGTNITLTFSVGTTTFTRSDVFTLPFQPMTTPASSALVLFASSSVP